MELSLIMKKNLFVTHINTFLQIFALISPSLFYVNQTFSGGLRGGCLELVSSVCPQASSLL